MKNLILCLLFALVVMPTLSSFARCDNPDDIAADGSRCGGRAASSRPGGRK
jgi:hypothetical protein